MTRSTGTRPTHIAFTRQLSVGLVEDGLAPDGRHTDGVAVRADPAHNSRERVPRLREAQAVEQRHRARSHRDDVSKDPPHPGRRALERLHGRRMVVALHLERDRKSFTEIEDSRVLPGPLQDPLPRARQPLQEERRVLVAAVLRPEEREDRELEVVRVTREQ